MRGSTAASGDALPRGSSAMAAGGSRSNSSQKSPGSLRKVYRRLLVRGPGRVRVVNYGSLTAREFVSEFWFVGRYYTSNDVLNSGECSVYRLGSLSCGTAVTVIADRAYRTTGYNYGANRFDGVVTC